MKEFEYKGLIVELEEFDQKENGGSGITWTSYVYKEKGMDYIDKYTISADSVEELETQVKIAIDKDF